MIRFKCSDCSAGLRVDDSRAGKLTACPRCGTTVRAPTRTPGEPEIVEELPVVENEEEILDAVAADEDEDRRRAHRRKIRSAPPPEEATDPGDFVTRNRIMGFVGIFFGLSFTSSALVTAILGAVDLRNPLNNPYNCGGCLGLLFGVLLIGVGAAYTIRG